jgi:DNA-binding NarL/FixJ family response regulator
LIVEDEAIIAIEIASTLKLLGYQVCGSVMNSDKALDAIKNTAPDLALLDINIKGSMNGIDIARIIRKKYHLPFVFLTSYSDTETLKEVQDTMPYGYIVKPFTESDLRCNIELALYKFKEENSALIPTFTELNSKLRQTLRQREYDVAILLYEGLTYKEIGSRLNLSVNTIKSYQKNLFTKLEVSSRSEAVRKLLTY